MARSGEMIRVRGPRGRDISSDAFVVLIIIITIFLFIFFFPISEEKEVNGHNEASQENKVPDCDTKDEDVAAADVVVDSPPVEFTVVHNKDKYVVSMPLSSTILQLKEKLFDMIGVPVKMQKIMIKGLAKDDQTLESLNVSSSSKIMVVGAKLQDIVAVSVANVEEVRQIVVHLNFKLLSIVSHTCRFRTRIQPIRARRLKNHCVRKNCIRKC